MTISTSGVGTCQLRGGRPKVLVYIAGKLRVGSANRIVGPRCSTGSGVAPTVFVSLLGPDVARLIINQSALMEPVRSRTAAGRRASGMTIAPASQR